MVCSSNGHPEQRRNLKPQVWGKHAWMFLYAVAMGYPNDPTPADRDAAKDMIESLQYLLPCHSCRQNFVNEMQENPIDEALDCSDSFTRYIFRLENIVSARTGGTVRTFDEAIGRVYSDAYGKRRRKDMCPKQYWHLVWIVLVVATVISVCTWALTRSFIMRRIAPAEGSRVLFMPSATR